LFCVILQVGRQGNIREVVSFRGRSLYAIQLILLPSMYGYIKERHNVRITTILRQSIAKSDRFFLLPACNFLFILPNYILISMLVFWFVVFISAWTWNLMIVTLFQNSVPFALECVISFGSFDLSCFNGELKFNLLKLTLFLHAP
jgi:hypothetical protein